jgi:hypothetical protein
VPGEKQTLNATVAYFIGCGLAEQLGKRTGAFPQSLQVSVSPVYLNSSAGGATLAPTATKMQRLQMATQTMKPMHVGGPVHLASFALEWGAPQVYHIMLSCGELLAPSIARDSSMLPVCADWEGPKDKRPLAGSSACSRPHEQGRARGPFWLRHHPGHVHEHHHCRRGAVCNLLIMTRIAVHGRHTSVM